MDADAFRYPVGRLQAVATPGRDLVEACVRDIAALPDALESAVAGLDDAALDTPYRDGGWTLRQVVHHLADSHSHASIRFRFALTADTPPVLAYDENAWARLPDASAGPVAPSLAIVRGVHARWVALLAGVPDDWTNRALVHPERGRIDLGFMIQLYAWHGRHHVAHITRARERLGF